MESGSYWLDKVRTSIWRDVRTLDIEEAYTTNYSIHPIADIMLCGFRLTNRWLSMKKDISSCGSKYLAYSEEEVEYQGSSRLLLQPELPERSMDVLHLIAWYGNECRLPFYGLLMPRVVKSRDEIFSRWGYAVTNRGLAGWSEIRSVDLDICSIISLGWICAWILWNSFRSLLGQEMILILGGVQSCDFVTSYTKSLELGFVFLSMTISGAARETEEVMGLKGIIDFLNAKFYQICVIAPSRGKKVIITETSVRRALQLKDDEGTECLPNATIFVELERMGVKTTAWNEFSSTMASAVICFATNQKFNFSKYIFYNMVKNLEGGVKFLMYPSYPLCARLVMVQAPKELGEGSEIPTDPQHTPTIIQPSTSQPQKKLPKRKQRKDTKVPQPNGSIEPITDKAVNEEHVPTHSNDPLLSGLGAQEDASKQGRKIADLDANAEVTLVNEAQARIDDLYCSILGVSTLIKIKAAKPKAVTTATTTTIIVVTRPKARVVVVQEPRRVCHWKKDQNYFVELIDKGRSKKPTLQEALRAEEIRRKPPTKAQKDGIKCKRKIDEIVEAVVDGDEAEKSIKSYGDCSYVDISIGSIDAIH
ncbi:hypothetical protein Tco_1560852 [Tanacetum coccineum]